MEQAVGGLQGGVTDVEDVASADEEGGRVRDVAVVILESKDAVDVHGEGGGAGERGDGLREKDQVEHGLHVGDVKLGSGCAADLVSDEVGLAEGLAEPSAGGVEGEGAAGELVGELAALVVEAVVAHDGGDEAEAGVGAVDAEGVDAIEEEAKAAYESAGLGIAGFGEEQGFLDGGPELAGLLIPRRALLALDEVEDVVGEDGGVDPAKSSGLHAVVDEGDVDDSDDGGSDGGHADAYQAIADLCEDADDPDVDGRGHEHVVDEAVPKRGVKQIAGAANVHGLAHGGAVQVQLKCGVAEQLVRELLVGHPPGVGARLHRDAAGCNRDASASASASISVSDGSLELRVKVHEGRAASNLLNLAAEAHNLRVKLYHELRVGWLVGRKVSLGLVEGDEAVLDALEELGLVGDLPRVEGVHVVADEVGEVQGEVVGDAAKVLGGGRRYGVADPLEVVNQEARAVQEGCLEGPSLLKHILGAIYNHVRGEKLADVDARLGLPRLRGVAVAEVAEAVDALEDSLGEANAGFRAEKIN